MSNEQFFDAAPEIGQTDGLIASMKKDDWQVEKQWGKDKTADFYAGMYAMSRVILSLMQSDMPGEFIGDAISKIAMDAIFIANEKAKPLIISG